MKKGAFTVTFIGLLLPYRLRIIYGFLLNFVLGSIKTNLILFGSLLLKTIVLFLCIFVFLIGLPITALLKKLIEKDSLFIESAYEESDILLRY